MKIGFPSLWFERGHAYITQTFKAIIENFSNHEIFILARTGDILGEKKEVKLDNHWKHDNIQIYNQWDLDFNTIRDWVNKYNIDMIIFNEEKNLSLIKECRVKLDVIIFTYLDYYEKEWNKYLSLYHGVLCSTRRSYNLVKNYCNAYYIGWYIDTNIFQPKYNNQEYTFFHNAGWVGANYRKMTPLLIEAFDELSKKFNYTLLIHSQLSIDKYPQKSQKIINENSKITFIEKTIPPPGLYSKGKIYIYPSKLDGLGLTLIEALSSGLPAITTNAPPMNEFVLDGYNGFTVKVSKIMQRNDNIGFPETIISKKDLIEKMIKIAQLSKQDFSKMQYNARSFILNNYNYKNGKYLIRILNKNKLYNIKVINLIGNLTNNWGVENHILSALEDLKFKINIIDIKKLNFNYHNFQDTSDLNLIIRGKGVNNTLLKKLKSPVVVWYSEILNKSYKDINPVAYERENDFYQLFPYLDYIFLHDKTNIPYIKNLASKFKTKSNLQIYGLFSYGVNKNTYKKTFRVKRYDVGIYGGNSRRRNKLIQYIRNKGIKIKEINAFGKKLTTEINKCKIVINCHFTNLLNIESIIVEVLSTDTFLLSETLSVKDIFIDNKHYVSWNYNNFNDIIDKINYYLSHKKERNQISRAGYNFVNKNLTMKYLVSELIRIVMESF